MRFINTKLKGVLLVDIEPQSDERGFFARTYCQNEFAALGLPTRLAQCSISYNSKKGTLRGMHYQKRPYAEQKLVRCTMGAIFDVVVDLRKESPTFRQWISVELSADNRQAIFIPANCAHGFQTLQDHSEVFYQMDEFYQPGSTIGFRWNDPAFLVSWPLTPTEISDRDRNYPDY